MSHTPGNDKTIDLETPGRSSPGAGEVAKASASTPGDTVDVTIDVAPKSPDGTIDLVPKAPDATIDLAPTPPGATIDLAPKVPDATIDLGATPAPTSALTLDHAPGTAATEANATIDGAAKPKQTTAASAAGTPTVPGYEILGVLGRGGMGVVYKARQARLNRLVALKMVLGGAHASPDQLTRFFTEAEAVAKLQHPNIVQIHEVGEFEGLPYFSLEFVAGGTLAEKIAAKPQPPREAAETMELLAYAMAAAHDRGIIHRDLKPANVLLDADGLPKITDFGLAKQIESDSSQTKSGTLMGTPSYMSPEQARGETRDIGPLSDLYSLGAILYELLTGRPPFVGPTILETVMMVRNQEPVPPTRLQPKCPRDLETICLKCLQKEPGQRYANCAELADDLHHFSAGEPIKARPVGWIERSWRWCKRNPRVAALSASVAVLAITAIAALGVVAVRMSREREAVAETRKIAGERLALATQRVAAGNYRQAQDFLQWSDPMLTHPDLEDVRQELQALRAQVDVFAEFHALLDSARFACRFGTRRQREEGRGLCHQLLGLYDEILEHKGRGVHGLPPLDDMQEQLFKEDVFEALLTAAQVERDLAVSGGAASQRQAAATAIKWLNQAEKLLPGTRALRVQRAPVWVELGDLAADKADMEQAKTITPASAVERFWHGFANDMRGDKARRDGDKHAAEEYYQEEIADYAAFLQQRPESFWGYFNWANAHVNLGQPGDLQDALVGYTACIRLRPDFPWSYNNRGTAHLRLGQLELAMADFTAALERNPAYAEAYTNRGLAHLALKKEDAALEDFSRAITANPDHVPAYHERVQLYLQRKQVAQAVGDLTKLLALTPDKQAILNKRVAAYRSLGKLSEAAGDLAELIKLNPKNLQHRADRAELLLALNKPVEARNEFDVILAQAPTAAKIWRARAIVNWQVLRDFDAALSDFERFANLSPNEVEPYHGTGVVLLGQRRYVDALKALAKALMIRPGYPEAVWARAQILIKQGRAADAVRELEPFVAKLPEGPSETLNIRASAYEALGKLTQAAADYAHMIELKPKEPDAYVCLARLLDKQGEPGKSKECLDRLVVSAPASMWSFIRRAEWRRDHGDFDGALADCGQAAKLTPASPVPVLVQASITAARGEAATAITAAERILDKAPADDGHVLFAAACVWSLAAGASKDSDQSKKYAERAADFLARTLDKGFHDLNYPEHNRMASEPALTAIAHLPRVQSLLKGAEPVSTDD